VIGIKEKKEQGERQINKAKQGKLKKQKGKKKKRKPPFPDPMCALDEFTKMKR